MFRAIAALFVLVPAMMLVKLAYVICPALQRGEVKQIAQGKGTHTPPWLDSPDDWDVRVH